MVTELKNGIENIVELRQLSVSLYSDSEYKNEFCAAFTVLDNSVMVDT